jgi:hypothetical protein
MLEYKEITRRGNKCEIQVIHIAKSLAASVSLLSSFESNFKKEIEAIPRVNISHCSDWYKLIINENVATLWHLDMHAEHDRKVGEIIEINKKDIYEDFFNN